MEPFDKCLVRNTPLGLWLPALYGKEIDGKFITSAGWQNMCIPYEGNEELVGTTDVPLSAYCESCDKKDCHGLDKCKIVRAFEEKVRNL